MTRVLLHKEQQSYLRELSALESLLTRESRRLAATSLPAFIDYVTPWFVPAKHHRLLIKHLAAIERRDIYRLMVLMPPGSAKSTYGSTLFPPWYMGRNPEHSVLAVSNVDPLAQRFGRRARNLVGTKEYHDVFGFGLNPGITSVTQWENQRGGEYYGTGILGGIGGRRMDLGLIDDPLKGKKDADSKTVRDAQWEWYKSDFKPRMKPNAAIVLITTRWHHDDLAGRVMREQLLGGDQWTILNLPMECESEDDPLRRRIGEFLWPEWFKRAEVEQVKKDSRTWNSLYQQRPSAEEGDIVKREWFRYYSVAPSEWDQIIMSWDMTFKNSSSSDWVVGQVWGRQGARKYLLDQVRDRMGFVETRRAVKRLRDKWPKATAILIEDKANGPAIIDTLREAISGIIAINPKDSKVARLEAISPQIEAGDVFLPETAPWIHDFIEEFLMFPNGVNDDQVDTATQALNYLARNERAGQVASVGETIYGSGNYGFSDRTGIASSTSSGGRIF